VGPSGSCDPYAPSDEQPAKRIGAINKDSNSFFAIFIILLFKLF
jgi:hypothetical protein